MSNAWLRDLYSHQAWADAEHWRALGAHQPARNDEASLYHRGQNATRLRELGGDHPTTALIVWHWKGRPAPAW
jgi:hypothetical protein